MKKYISVLLLLSAVMVQAQHTKRVFYLIDSETEQPVAFANIIFNNTPTKGTSSDIDGAFFVPEAISSITISYIGYETKTISITTTTEQIIGLTQQPSSLDEVIIENWVNPAHRIIELAVTNKPNNNPEQLQSFTYQSYDKIIVTAEELKIDSTDIKQDKITKDSTDAQLNDFLNESYLFITETVAKHKYLKPRLSEDSIIATRSSGFKSPNFALLANSIQPFSFYKDYITLFETDYLNPISKGSTNKYKFRLKEEYLRGEDTVFVISFEPKANRNFEGLKGLIQINSKGYAVQSVDATTFNSGKIRYNIQQKYVYIDNSTWFPEQLNFKIQIGETIGLIKYQGKSYISQVSINPQLSKNDFSILPPDIGISATAKDSLFWSSTRQDPLSNKELRTYVLIDSIGERANLDRILDISSGLTNGRLSFNYVDVDLTKILQFNKYEGLRLGAGFYTNDDLIKNLSIGGFAGYGIRDSKWKYGGELIYSVQKSKAISFHLGYENNLRETGRSYFQVNQPLFNSRQLIAEQMDNIEALSFKAQMKVLRNVEWTVGLTSAQITPLYDYTFESSGQTITKYTNTQLNFGISYFFNETLTNVFNSVVRLESDAPIINLSYSRGLQDVFDGEFSYNKLQFTFDDSFRLKGLGRMTYRVDAGLIDNSIPYGQLFTGEGSLDRKLPFVFQNYFQTMEPYEFLSDRYLHLFTRHNLGMLLNNKGMFTPEVVLYNNFGIGNLSDPENHQSINFKIKDALYMETGLELRNLLTIDYFDIGYLGLGAGVFYRYGPLRLEDSGDNLVFKLAMGFTFK